MTLDLDDLEAKAKAATPGMHKDEIVEHAKKCDLGNQSCHNCPALKCCDNTSPAKAVLAAVPELIERCRKAEAGCANQQAKSESVAAQLIGIIRERDALKAELATARDALKGMIDHHGHCILTTTSCSSCVAATRALAKGGK